MATSTSKPAPKTTLPKEIFAVEVKNHQLLHQAYRAYLAGGRNANAKTLTRGLVHGGGIKPWRQKGTGRARVGSIRSPIWKGGGITFGPTGGENYTVKLPLKAKRQAIRQALTLKASAGIVKQVDNFEIKDGKTKTAAALLKTHGATRRTLIVVEQKTPEIMRAIRNLTAVEVVSARYLNVYLVLNADTIIITKGALAAVKDWLGAVKSTEGKGE